MSRSKNPTTENVWLQVVAILSGKCVKLKSDLENTYIKFLASMASVSVGTLYSWPSPSIPKLISEDYPGNITLEQVSYLTIIPSITAIFSNPIFSYLINVIGRKYSLLLVALPQFIAWILIVSTESIYVFYISRIFSGLADSCLLSALPAYIGEIATPHVRGFWGNIPVFNICIGQLLINTIGGYLDIKSTGYILSCFPIILAMTFVFMPESPYYLLLKGKRDEAEKSLKRLRRKLDVTDELREIEAAIQRQTGESANLKDLIRNKTNRKALTIAIFVRTAQMVSGIAAFGAYTQLIFHLAGGDLSPTLSSIIFSITVLVMIVPSAIILDNLGRRLSMIISCAGCSLTLGAEALYFYIGTYTNIDISDFTWFPVTAMVVYLIIYCIGLGLAPIILVGEVFATNIKGKGLGVVNLIFNIYVVAINKLFPFLTSSYGLYMPFLFYSLCTFVCTLFSFWWVPETKGKTLEEI